MTDPNDLYLLMSCMAQEKLFLNYRNSTRPRKIDLDNPNHKLPKPRRANWLVADPHYR